MINLNAAFFEALIGQPVSIRVRDEAEAWVVDSVTRRTGHSARTDQPFDVYFSAPPGRAPQQGLMRATTAGDEVVEFFAVPIAATADAVTYEAVFN